MNHQSDHKVESFIEEKLKEFDENVNYDEAELGCEWSQNDLREWIKNLYQEQQDRFERLVEERRLINNELGMPHGVKAPFVNHVLDDLLKALEEL